MPRLFESSVEFVGNGHPDRLCDLIASIIINDIQHKDSWNSHAAIEVFLTHDTCIISGEAKTTLEITDNYLKGVIAQAYKRAGYLSEMRKYWNKSEVCLAEDLKIENRIFAQSPDIALGTTDKGHDTGWNDQNISFSSSENSNENHLGIPMLIASDLGDFLRLHSETSILEDKPIKFGPDIKVLVTCRTLADGVTATEISAITIAIPSNREASIEDVRKDIESAAREFITMRQDVYCCPIANDCKFVINGTGRFVVHGNISDVSMTGRKLSVNHPSAGPLWENKMIGGGSLVKPAHASDLLLPLAARFIANVLVWSEVTSHAVVGLSCGIGQKEPQGVFIHGDQEFERNSEKAALIEQWFRKNIDISPSALIERFKLFENDFSKVVETNFFCDLQWPWENFNMNKALVESLQEYVKTL